MSISNAAAITNGHKHGGGCPKNAGWRVDDDLKDHFGLSQVIDQMVLGGNTSQKRAAMLMRTVARPSKQSILQPPGSVGYLNMCKRL